LEKPHIESSVRITDYYYWRQKPQFALDKDLYSSWTVFAAEEGKFAYRIGGKAGEAGFGDLVVCPPDVWFHRRMIEPLTFHFFHYNLETDSASPAPPLPPLPAGIVTISDTNRLFSCYGYLKKLADRTDPEAVRWRDHLIKDMIQLHQMEASMKPAQPPHSDVQAEMLQAKEYIKGKAFEEISLRELAERLEITPVQLTRRFRQACGMTPTEYLTKLRIERAARLLEETAFNLDEIAQKVGYENGFYLSRVFAKHKGMSPSAYRKTRRV